MCGSAAQTKQTQLVKNVDEFPGHIACDGDSRSEIVVPIVDGTGQLVAIIDVDCAELDGFDEVDRKWLEDLATLLSKGLRLVIDVRQIRHRPAPNDSGSVL